ncbi:MAG: hydroxymethylglutaryl-CoA lyase [Rhodobacteraceae bacterium]|nr:hydroxymethylglutaryl-CoA lyase [Paracoccaceae bacterium]PHR53924.1 MAG: hydroxymethylglutaryl-CoA lyase [Robiginitomaculum sp.]
MTDQVLIYEVGPRDGLQNEKEIISTAKKIALINLLSLSGLRKIECTSFVSPKWVPQLSDAHDVLTGIMRAPGIDYAALTPNLKGFEYALAAGADEVAIFASASEGFSQKNINCSIAESLARFEPVMAAAKAASIPVRGYVSCVVACPYDGAVRPDAVQFVAKALFDMGCYEVSLGDTIGAGRPDTVATMIKAVSDVVPTMHLAGHFHDTGDRALDNIKAALELGVTTFDSAVGGLGGCPYAPGAKGNVSTAALVNMFISEGIETGVDRVALAAAEKFLTEIAVRKTTA